MGWLTDAFFGKTTRQSKEAVPAESSDIYHQSSGSKIIPEVVIDHVEPQCSADMSHLELWIRLKNTAPFDVEVTEVRVLGQSQGLNRFLKSGESHDCCVYKGSIPINDANHVAQVDYKVTGNGDYFESDHQIEYRYEDTEHGKYYIPEEFHLIRPVRDR